MTFYECRNLIVKGQSEKQGNLWLGDYESARNKKKLKADNIYSVITAGLGMKISYSKDYNHKMLALYDHESENIQRFFESSYEFIDNALKSGNLLIHCYAGVSRSTTILSAYLMKKNSWTAKQTLALVKKNRPYIGPNKGFLRQLKRYQNQMNNVPYEKMGIQEKIVPGKELDYLKKIRIGNKVNFNEGVIKYESKNRTKDQPLVKKQESKIISYRSKTVQKK